MMKCFISAAVLASGLKVQSQSGFIQMETETVPPARGVMTVFQDEVESYWVWFLGTSKLVPVMKQGDDYRAMKKSDCQRPTLDLDAVGGNDMTALEVIDYDADNWAVAEADASQHSKIIDDIYPYAQDQME